MALRQQGATVNGVDIVRYVAYYVLFLYWLLLLVRIVTEFVRLVARSWTGPTGWAATGMELVYAVTDPPVRLLRKVIPTVRLGGIGVDLAVTVLFIALVIAMQIVRP
jgi:YggT family protein